MDKNQAKKSIKKITGDSASLNPTSLINLFEIDTSEIAINESLLKNLKFGNSIDKIFRFHNNIKYINGDIWFNGNKYSAAPIRADGFEVTSKGTLPRPKLSMTVNDQGITIFSKFKDLMRDLQDLVGSKVIRRRTFIKYLDAETFSDNSIDKPDGFAPDPFAQFPEDIYYIDRKSGENKYSLEFELSTALELEEIRLPGRILSQRKCPFTYRSAGCCYEYSSRRIIESHGSSSSGNEAKLPASAPAMANEKDELISTILTPEGGGGSQYDPSNQNGEIWQRGISYPQGKAVYITVKNVNYYYVAKLGGAPANEPPPNETYWVPDQCSKTLRGCKIRWGAGTIGQNSSSLNDHLPFGGFPGISRNA
tara:strand:+ start:53 stop:1147 length:1095 start_codon:yes stop_codon:yes gene_type:complete